MNSSKDIWNEHYTRDKARLAYPDENLVRVLARIKPGGEALDFGAGSGRHSILLDKLGYKVTAVDYSQNSIQLIKDNYPNIQTQIVNEPPYLFENARFFLIVSWGVLHYNKKKKAKIMVGEYQRMLKKDGYCVGTVRATSDTHLKMKDGLVGLEDIKNSKVHLYTLDDLKQLLSSFAEVRYAYMERTPLGQLEDRICHWIFLAKN